MAYLIFLIGVFAVVAWGLSSFITKTEEKEKKEENKLDKKDK